MNLPAPALPALPIFAPSLFAADHAALGDAVAECRALGLRDFHVDVMDGRLVPSLGLSFRAVASLAARFPDCAFDLHLMVEGPECHLDAALDCGARRVTLQIEGAPYLHAAIDRIRAAGALPGVALGPLAGVQGAVGLAQEAEHVLVMLIEPGRPAGPLRPAGLSLLRAVRAALPRHVVIADGAVGCDSLPGVAPHCDIAVSGTALFANGPAAGLAALNAALAGA